MADEKNGGGGEGENGQRSAFAEWEWKRVEGIETRLENESRELWMLRLVTERLDKSARTHGAAIFELREDLKEAVKRIEGDVGTLTDIVLAIASHFQVKL
jgi:hypothetical protein